MTRKLKTRTIIQLALVLLIAFALKYHYSTAAVDDLRWILGPTTFLVEAITDKHFEFESHAGYMSDDHTFLIAASCSGVNFLIIAFLVLTLGKVRHEWPRNIEWRFVPIAMLGAYVATLIANTTRIVVALSMRDFETRWLDADELHRIEGILVYFGFLILLFWASEKFARRGEPSAATIAFQSRYLLIIYYAVTLGIPLARGSWSEPGFRQHALFVILIPLTLIVPQAVLGKIKDRYA